ncbi:glycosyltransferase family 4 protein [Algirhabdus cladophorae]|uniref:glycosyltransferase family 4 protein n=1 Tax=Algirhabdus cladophorae TaxID=3377108 RepID=UPI003B847888
MTSDKIRLGFLCAHNPLNRGAFSGTPFYMLRALQARSDVEVTVLGRYKAPNALTRVTRRLWSEPVPRLSDIREHVLDAIVAPVSSGLVAELGPKVEAPMTLVTDATPQFLREFYGDPVPLEADVQEEAALQAAAQVIYSSDFMRQRAMQEFAHLDLPPLKAFPFGVNLDELPAKAPQKPSLDKVNLLFIGVHWQRKGGDQALAALDVLRTQGVNAHLTVIGSTSPEADAHPHVTVLGYINKNDPKDAATLNKALAAAHVFVLPTRADCTPMVVAEANAYGCPVVITRTGGIPSLIKDGVNGLMVDEASDATQIAATIQNVIAADTTYAALSASSFEFCHKNLTWDAWCDAFLASVRSGI